MGDSPKIKCPKCGQVQTAENPLCLHVAGKLGGAKLRDRKKLEDPGYYSRIGKKGGTVHRDALAKKDKGS